MLNCLLRAGANYRRQFALTLTGQVYYFIQDWAAKPENGGISHMPEYGVYFAKLEEERLDTVFWIDHWSDTGGWARPVQLLTSFFT